MSKSQTEEGLVELWQYMPCFIDVWCFLELRRNCNSKVSEQANIRTHTHARTHTDFTLHRTICTVHKSNLTSYQSVSDPRRIVCHASFYKSFTKLLNSHSLSGPLTLLGPAVCFLSRYSSTSCNSPKICTLGVLANLKCTRCVRCSLATCLGCALRWGWFKAPGDLHGPASRWIKDWLLV